MRISGEIPNDWELNWGNIDNEVVGNLFSGMIVVRPINPGSSLVYSDPAKRLNTLCLQLKVFVCCADLACRDWVAKASLAEALEPSSFFGASVLRASGFDGQLTQMGILNPVLGTHHD